MNQHVMSRLLAALILAGIFGGALYLRMERRVSAGLDVFLTEQRDKWSTVYTSPSHLIGQVAAATVLFLLLVFVYECLSFGLDQLWRRLRRHD